MNTSWPLLGDLLDYRAYKRTPEFKRLAAALHAGLLTFHEFNHRVHLTINYRVINRKVPRQYTVEVSDGETHFPVTLWANGLSDLNWKLAKRGLFLVGEINYA